MIFVADAKQTGSVRKQRYSCNAADGAAINRMIVG
jgi:hypothetical protein